MSSSHGSGSAIHNNSFANRTTTISANKIAPKPVAVSTKPVSGAVRSSGASNIGGGARRITPTSGRTTNGNNESTAAVHELETRMSELKLTVDSLERERDFYYGKLREIEVLCQGNEEQEDAKMKDYVEKVLEILYATEEGFAVPEEGGDNNGGTGNGHEPEEY